MCFCGVCLYVYIYIYMDSDDGLMFHSSLSIFGSTARLPNLEPQEDPKYEFAFDSQRPASKNEDLGS